MVIVKNIIKEPLVHFLLLGVALFFVFGWLNRNDREAPDEIVVGESLMMHLASRFERTWQRPPTDDEFEALIENWIRDEVLYREGLSMGMDVNDPIVRRRIAQKVEIFAETLAPYSATDAELEGWLSENSEQYRVPPRFTLRQVYFDPARHGDRLEADVAAARQVVEADADAVAGDVTMLPAREEDISAIQIARTFGEDFAAALESATPGAWFGPVRSGFGLHLVLVEARVEGRMPGLDEVRDEVERDFLAKRIEATRDAFYEELRKRYTVRVDSETAEDSGP